MLFLTLDPAIQDFERYPTIILAIFTAAILIPVLVLYRQITRGLNKLTTSLDHFSSRLDNLDWRLALKFETPLQVELDIKIIFDEYLKNFEDLYRVYGRDAERIKNYLRLKRDLFGSIFKKTLQNLNSKQIEINLPIELNKVKDALNEEKIVSTIGKLNKDAIDRATDSHAALFVKRAIEIVNDPQNAARVRLTFEIKKFVTENIEKTIVAYLENYKTNISFDQSTPDITQEVYGLAEKLAFLRRYFIENPDEEHTIKVVESLKNIFPDKHQDIKDKILRDLSSLVATKRANLWADEHNLLKNKISYTILNLITEYNEKLSKQS